MSYIYADYAAVVVSDILLQQTRRDSRNFSLYPFSSKGICFDRVLWTEFTLGCIGRSQNTNCNSPTWEPGYIRLSLILFLGNLDRLEIQSSHHGPYGFITWHESSGTFLQLNKPPNQKCRNQLKKRLSASIYQIIYGGTPRHGTPNFSNSRVRLIIVA